MEFAIENCAMLIMNSKKRETIKGIQLPIQESIRTLGKDENYELSVMLKAGINKLTEIKEKVKKRVHQED